MSAPRTPPGGVRPPPAFAGNKRALPAKPCKQCGLAMTWRRAWARSWDEVRYCSDRCRAEARRGAARTGA